MGADGGSWINERTHGLQFKAAFLKASPPITLEGMKKYLGSGMIRCIGPVYATKLRCQSLHAAEPAPA